MPQKAPPGAGPHQADRLLDPDLAVLLPRTTRGVGKLKICSLLQPDQLVAHLGRPTLHP